MSEQLLDVLSVLDDQDNPVLGNCTLQMGELALEFKNGRSKVPLRHAAEVARHPKIQIPGYDGPVAPLPPNASAELPADALAERERSETTAEREARVAAAEEYLISQGLAVPSREGEPAPAPAPEVAGLEARIAELEEMLKQAVDLGGAPAEGAEADDDPADDDPVGDAQAGDGEGDDDEAETAADTDGLPKGFDAETADGKPRCWARTGAGTQCKNASLEDSHACNLKAHQKLVG